MEKTANIITIFIQWFKLFDPGDSVKCCNVQTKKIKDAQSMLQAQKIEWMNEANLQMLITK